MVRNRIVARVACREGQAADCGHEEDRGYDGDGQKRSSNVGQDREAILERSYGGTCDQNQSEKKNQNDDGSGKPQLSDTEEHDPEKAEASKQRKGETIDRRESLRKESAKQTAQTEGSREQHNVRKDRGEQSHRK